MLNDCFLEGKKDENNLLFLSKKDLFLQLSVSLKKVCGSETSVYPNTFGSLQKIL